MGQRVRLRVSEIFESIQGEGRYAGTPVTFLRLSGCTRKCSWCDTSYHRKGKLMDVSKITTRLRTGGRSIIVVTGGEPWIQKSELMRLISYCESMGCRFEWHLETNGDRLLSSDIDKLLSHFSYVCISPKDTAIAAKCIKLSLYYLDKFDLKVVTDLQKVGVELIGMATMLMPLTTKDPEQNMATKRRVWEYCVKYGYKYSPRLHVDLFCGARGV